MFKSKLTQSLFSLKKCCDKKYHCLGYKLKDFPLCQILLFEEIVLYVYVPCPAINSRRFVDISNTFGFFKKKFQVRDYGTHYLSSAFLGAKMSAVTHFTSYERLKLDRQELEGDYFCLQF